MTGGSGTGGRRSAGILLHRVVDGERQVLLGHMGGPFWARKDEGAWSIPKGEPEGDEEPLATAYREFAEELGVPVPEGVPVPLGEVRQSGGKVVAAWAVEADLDPERVVPGTFTLEWPRGSGVVREFPEVDRVAWFPLAQAGVKVVKAQRELLDRLAEIHSFG
ncbi:NUDIX domain-containing protein [Saccharothrix sp. S26]|uniref:NUDIX domain-containing protein n=1 Tax=Saccharothrix sp. S26 TaxID=2907215 RepID=UPI001F2CA902|nr:NUDIX domain-containing protein [Saccharothrix sp. S26]MCE6997595.1 NUDIX domain-containing protein [Saccharothrix sp. S26]